ncbi:unnamed protein product [Mytilus coruscus]|uniref:DDE Tnp4 domain-containing protein n=1 Tax=Mytilus coruscus TaxID=42192 RepID=A0A6J8C215_MYTCO|nr:unnamed protein product [Mytilus coruscus]
MFSSAWEGWVGGGPPPVCELSLCTLDSRPKCTEDKDFQTSTTYVAAYWIIPNEFVNFTRQSFIAVEERVHFGEEFWRTFQNYTYVGKHDSFTIGDLNLQPGRFYRSSIKFCAEENCCFPEVKSDGFIVLHSNPKTGGIEVVHEPILGESDQVLITLERMYDPDVEDEDEAIGMIDYYEWAIGNDIGIITKWNQVEGFPFSNVTHVRFQLPLNGSLDFSKCQRIYVRGYNKAGMWSEVSSDIKDCNVTDRESFIIPNLVIDAVGKQERGIDGMVHEGYGKDIFLDQNVAWKDSDIDYTPYKNILSAVWPNLRHRNYTWAVCKIINSSSNIMHYKDDILQLTDPCSSPNAIKCGITGEGYVNVRFSERKLLKHGERYMICISAPQMVVNHEEWNETLEEISDCSDGVTVDLTPPTAGHVWIGIDVSDNYQASTSDIHVNWESFVDVEQIAETRHTSAIRTYHLGIGSTIDGQDVVPFTDIGIANHYTLHNLRLQNGNEYFASVKAYDFTGKSTTVTSAPVIIDNTPPERTLSKIQISERQIKNFTELNACWKDVFLDNESGIDYYMWGVGSRKGHDDVIPFIKTEQDCEVSTKHNDFDIQEGHSYFITVKAINRAHLINSASSSSYKVDQSAPIDGYVYDGCRHNATDLMNDLDYQVDARTLSSCWEGFSDPHSAIQMYYIRIGTCPRCQDVLYQVPVGIIYDFTLHDIHLTCGLKYFTTVTACNTGDLCTSVTSDGVLFDDSPPNVGVVQDGIEKDDTNYQSFRNYIAFEWYGFTDPQSSLDKLSWKAGTKRSSDDIVPLTELPITKLNPIVVANLTTDLPLGRRIFVTVRVYNKAGLFSEASSNGFIVDETPPVFAEKVLAVHDYWPIDKDLVVFRTIIEVKWEVEDKESFIDHQNISVNYHIGGKVNSSTVQFYRKFSMVLMCAELEGKAFYKSSQGQVISSDKQESYPQCRATDYGHIDISCQWMFPPSYRYISLIYQKKSYPRSNVQAVCNAKGRFTNINANWPCCRHDSHVLRTSQVCAHVERNGNWENGILLGDSAYPCR